MNTETLTLNLCKLSYIVTMKSNAKVFKKYIAYGSDLVNNKLIFDLFESKLKQDELSYTQLYDCLDFALSRLKSGLDLMQVLESVRGTKQYHSFIDKKYQAAI